MSCTRTKPDRSHGIANSSLNLAFENEKKVCIKKAEKISRFFTKISKGTATSEEMDEIGVGASLDSPYKNCLNEVKPGKLNDSASDLDDFKTPTTIKKVSKISYLKPTKSKPTKRRKGASNTAPVRKFIEDNFKGGDVNADHLQMALALSESSYEVENPTVTLTPNEKMESFKKALEKYGFGYSKNRIKAENKQDLYEISKKNKKSRYRYITPILKMRTPEERNILISSKVSLILAQNTTNHIKSNVKEETKIFSDLLQQHHHQKLLKLNHLEVEQLNGGKIFYVGLKLDVSLHLNGHLLKDWRAIAGRETSPQRNISTRSISPDLFGSDDEYQVPAQKYSETVMCNDLNPLEKVTELRMVTCHELNKLDTFSSDDQYQFLEISFEPSAWRDNDALMCHALNQSDVQENDNSICMYYDLTQSDGEGTSVETSGTVNNCPAKFSGSQKKMENENTLRKFLILEDHCNEQKWELSEFREKTRSSKTSRFQLSPSSSEETDSRTNEKCYIEQDFDPIISKAAKQDDQCCEAVSSSHEYEPIQPFNQHLQSFTDLEIDFLSPESLSETAEQGRCREVLILSPEHDYRSTQPPPEHVESFTEVSYPLTKKTERVSSSEDDSKLSQESIYISDDEINYSSVCATPHAKRNNENTPPNTNLGSSKDSFDDILDQTQVLEQIETPQNINVVIKTQDVTPMTNYDAMDTPRITKELYRFGLKPLKRHRGAKLLKYIYDSTHPLVEVDSSGDGREVKRRRTGSLHFKGVVGDIVENEWIFERAQSKKIASCRVPLHIVWHNFVMCNSKIREKMLLYEPLQLEVLHSMLKEQGFKFNIQDLLTFLDKKCITIRTAQGQRYGKKQRS